MLTKDQNLIRIDLTVQYQVKDAQKYLFEVRDPELTLQEATESALRDVVGSKDMDELLSRAGGRGELVIETKQQLQGILEKYDTGLRISKVNLENMQPPKEVRAAFDDAINAEEDEDRYKKKAEAYENDIIPKAEGNAIRLEQEASGYRQQVIDKAKGETSRFLQTLKEYTKAPEITRKRLYLETMESVLSNSSKVLIKVKQGNSLMYLPLDKLMRQSEASGARVLDSTEIQRALSDSANSLSRRTISRPDVRSREGR
jgi:membrane protease subunit HflK